MPERDAYTHRTRCLFLVSPIVAVLEAGGRARGIVFTRAELATAIALCRGLCSYLCGRFRCQRSLGGGLRREEFQAVNDLAVDVTHSIDHRPLDGHRGRNPMTALAGNQIIMPFHRHLLDVAPHDHFVAIVAVGILPLAGRHELAEAFAKRIDNILLELLERGLPAGRFRWQHRKRALGDQIAAIDSAQRDILALLARDKPVAVVLDAETHRRRF